jgi:hypothetical protein
VWRGGGQFSRRAVDPAIGPAAAGGGSIMRSEPRPDRRVMARIGGFHCARAGCDGKPGRHRRARGG